MKTFRNILASLLLVVSLSFAPTAFAEDASSAAATCSSETVAQMQDEAKNMNLTVEHLSAADAKTLTDSLGAPPEEYSDLYVLSNDAGVSVMVVVKNDCLLDITVPFKTETLNAVLNRNPA